MRSANVYDEPFGETNGFDSHPSGPGQFIKPVFNHPDTFGVDAQGTDNFFTGIDRSECNRRLVEINPNKAQEPDGSYVTAFAENFVSFCFTTVVFRNNFLKKGQHKIEFTSEHTRVPRPLHAFTTTRDPIIWQFAKNAHLISSAKQRLYKNHEKCKHLQQTKRFKKRYFSHYSLIFGFLT